MSQGRFFRWIRRMTFVLAFAPALAMPQGANPAFEPQIGQAGKDVIWVPTPDFVVERMLQMTQVGPQDYVVDLGSGDGRTVITAVKKFGARSLGIEYNPDMVALSQRNAERAGVSERAKFLQGDIFATDFSQATVVTMYLLPDLNLRLRPKLLDMKPGTRLASHQFSMAEWQPDEVSDFEGRSVYFWIVPAKVEGNWRLTIDGKTEFRLNFTQRFQMIEGGIALPESRRLGIRDASLRGDRIGFAFVDQHGVLREFSGRVNGDVIEGSISADGKSAGRFRAQRAAST